MNRLWRTTFVLALEAMLAMALMLIAVILATAGK
jgi:hypothetical protein